MSIREALNGANVALEEAERLLSLLYTNTDKCHMYRKDIEERCSLINKARICVNLELAEIALASEDGWQKPDYIFDAENWDTTYNWRDRSELANIVATEGDFEPWRFETLYKGQPVWARNVVLTRDEYGDPDETEVRWFDSEEEARACQPCPFPEGK